MRCPLPRHPDNQPVSSYMAMTVICMAHPPFSGGDTFVTCIHTFNSMLVLFEVDFRLFAIAYTVDKSIDQSDPFIKTGVLDGQPVIG